MVLRRTFLCGVTLMLCAACARKDATEELLVGRARQALSHTRTPEQEMSVPNTTEFGVAMDGDHAAFALVDTHPYRREGGSWIPDGDDIGSDPSARVPDSSYRYVGSTVDISGDALFNASFYEDGDATSDGTLSPSFRIAGALGPHWYNPAPPDDQILPSGASYSYGLTVSVDGNRAVAVAHKNVGLGEEDSNAYMLARSGQVWSEETLLASTAFPKYITSVSISGGTVALGSPNSVFVYVLNGSTWSLQKQIDAPETMPANDNSFGDPVALSGDTLVAGRWRDEQDGVAAGAAYVYTRASGVWTLRQKLRWSRGAAGARFGSAVAIDGDTILLGAYGAGSAVVYGRLPGGTFVERRTLVPSTTADESVLFGYSGALSGTQAIVGSHRGAHFYSLLLEDGEPCAGDAPCVSNRCVASACAPDDGGAVKDSGAKAKDASGGGVADAGTDAGSSNPADSAAKNDGAAGGAGGIASASGSAGGAVGAGGIANASGGVSGTGGAAGAAASSGGREGGSPFGSGGAGVAGAKAAPSGDGSVTASVARSSGDDGGCAVATKHGVPRQGHARLGLWVIALVVGGRRWRRRGRRSGQCSELTEHRQVVADTGLGHQPPLLSCATNRTR